jgi:hypothetical protein
MAHLVSQLAFDLKQRCSFLAATLRGRKAALPAPANVYCARMAERLERTAQLIDDLITDGRLRKETPR